MAALYLIGFEQAIARFRPAAVFTHTTHDLHQDHRAVRHATMTPARGVPQIACYQSPSTTVDFRPNRFVPIDGFVDSKLAAIAEYRSQTARADYLDPGLLAATARYWSRYSGSLAAEALEVVRDSSSLLIPALRLTDSALDQFAADSLISSPDAFALVAAAGPERATSGR